MGGSLTDDQLKEFDAYLNGTQPVNNNINDIDDEEPMELPKPEQKIIDDEVKIEKADTDYLNKIVELHTKKADDIMELLDRIDAKGHKDIVADLVDEMQYQKGVVKREKDQLDRLKQLFAQAQEAAK